MSAAAGPEPLSVAESADFSFTATSGRSTVTRVPGRALEISAARESNSASGGRASPSKSRTRREATISPTARSEERAPATPAPRSAAGRTRSQREATARLAFRAPSPVMHSANSAFPMRARAKAPSKRASCARDRTAPNSSRNAVTIAIGRLAADITVLAEPGDGAAESLLDGSLRKTQLAHGFSGIEEHLVAGHAHAFERDSRRTPRQPGGVGVGGSGGQ